MAVNKVVFGNTTIMDISDSTLESDDELALGVTAYDRSGALRTGTLSTSPYSFVGMVVQGTNLSTLSDVQAIYGSDTTWQLISSVALASEHIFGNGYTLGLSNGTNTIGMQRTNSAINGNGAMNANPATFGTSVGTNQSGNNTTSSSSTSLGVVTKNETGNNPEYTGIIADTITVYSWERTA